MIVLTNKKNNILREKRRKKLKALLKNKCKIKLIEAHNGISARIASDSHYETNGGKKEFDGIWVSSLTCSASKGLPDIELDCLIKRIDTVDEILLSTNLPVIVDVDTGGSPENFKFMCAKLEQIGVSAVVIEDKSNNKKNSLLINAHHDLEDPYVVCEKINTAKDNCLTDDFLIFARIESLIAKAGMDDAIKRAVIYNNQSSADGIVIHSNKGDPIEIFEFINKYKELDCKLPLICIPTTYSHIKSEDLFDKGIDIVIYANHLLRASVHAMINTCDLILKNDRTKEADESSCYPVASLLKLVN